ncbi:MAG: efflux RND transporter periplasmic adaptor subunit [Archangium sp.]|nr:efflux RND transporter periplasmic adaptor subunit [Archangium sp.]
MRAWPKVVAVGAALIAGVVGGGLWWKGRSTDEAPPFVTAPVTRGDVVSRVTATGTLSATVTVQVGTQVSGRIQSLAADFNSQVKKGDVLATIDPQLFSAALAQSVANEKAAQANVARAKAQAADAERKLRRAAELAAQKLIAPADLDAAQAEWEVARATIDAAEAAVSQARAQRQQAQVNLAYTIISSPIDGTIISRAVDVGQTVAASLASPTLFTIAENLTSMQVHTNVAEADVGKLKTDLTATFSVDAFPNRRFTGRIRQIRYAAQVVSNVVTYDAVIDVENPELLLRPGMTANVTFTTQEAKDVLKVPNAALRFRFEPMGKSDEVPAPKPGTRAVTVLRAGKPLRVAVATGVTDGSFTEVLSGLEEGDLVVTDRSGAASSSSGTPRSGSPQRGASGPPTRLF